MRVHFLTLDGFYNNSGDVVDQIGTEAFLRGCHEKEAARYVIERNPRTINEALKWIKASMANHRAIYGSRSSIPQARNYFSHRQVTFADTPVLSAHLLLSRSLRPQTWQTHRIRNIGLILSSWFQ